MIVTLTAECTCLHSATEALPCLLSFQKLALHVVQPILPPCTYPIVHCHKTISVRMRENGMADQTDRRQKKAMSLMPHHMGFVPSAHMVTQTISNSSPGDFMPPSGFCGYQAYLWHIKMKDGKHSYTYINKYYKTAATLRSTLLRIPSASIVPGLCPSLSRLHQFALGSLLRTVSQKTSVTDHISKCT